MSVFPFLLILVFLLALSPLSAQQDSTFMGVEPQSDSIFTPEATDREDPATYPLQVRVKQVLFPRNFLKKQVRFYTLQGNRLEIAFEHMNDGVPEVSIAQEVTDEKMELLMNTIERNRIMDLYINCQVFSRPRNFRLKTVLHIEYKGKTKTCYSFDKAFAGELEDFISAINQIIPQSKYHIEMTYLNAPVGDYSD